MICGPPALVVTHANAVSSRPGGLQRCTDEYLRTLSAAGFDVHIVTIAPSPRRLPTRVARRFRARAYRAGWDSSIPVMVAEAARRWKAAVVFLNAVDLAGLAPLLRPRLDDSCRIVLLSHGVESVDFLHEAANGTGGRRLCDAAALGHLLLDEARQRRSIDHVVSLTAFEAEFERWLGTPGSSWLPRTMSDHPGLPWKPDPRRLGFVGTLDHPPTRSGLVAFLEALGPVATNDLKVRLVGGPTSAGGKLARRFPRVQYLGELSDEALEEEAATWSCFVHPLFCLARGCSTKLAVALAWRLPIATTSFGCRGYEWRAGALPLADTPEQLARLAINLTNPAVAAAARQAVASVAASTPTLTEVAGRLARALCHRAESPAEQRP